MRVVYAKLKINLAWPKMRCSLTALTHLFSKDEKNDFSQKTFSTFGINENAMILHKSYCSVESTSPTHFPLVANIFSFDFGAKIFLS